MHLFFQKYDPKHGTQRTWCIVFIKVCLGLTNNMLLPPEKAEQQPDHLADSEGEEGQLPEPRLQELPGVPGQPAVQQQVGRVSVCCEIETFENCFIL